MIGLNFKDVFIEGNKAGFAIGGVPTVSSNDSGWGTDGSMPIALETWYQFQVTDNISVTPGVFWVSGQNGHQDRQVRRLTSTRPAAMSGAASSKPSSSSDLSLGEVYSSLAPFFSHTQTISPSARRGFFIAVPQSALKPSALRLFSAVNDQNGESAGSSAAGWPLPLISPLWWAAPPWCG